MKTSTYINLGVFEIIGSVLIIILLWNDVIAIKFFCIFLTLELALEVFASGYYRKQRDALVSGEEQDG